MSESTPPRDTRSNPITVDRLGARMRESAAAALEHYSSGERDRFGLEAGIALEMGAKAVLFGIHPSLIVDLKSQQAFESLLQAAGHEGGSSLPPGLLRTIGCDEAVRRVELLHPILRPHRAAFTLIIQSRNGFVHIGNVEAAVVAEALPSYVTGLARLAEILGIPVSALFGAYAEVARGLIDKAAEDATTTALGQIARAKERWRDRYGHLEEEPRQALVASIESRYAFDDYDEALTTCPACGGRALVSGAYEVGEWRVTSYDHEGNAEGAYLPTTMHALELECRICGLKLADSDQLAAAGVATEYEDEIDPRDYYDDFDP